MEKCCRYDEPFTSTKYVVQRILGSQQEFDPRGKATVLAPTSRDICQIWSHNSSIECRWAGEKEANQRQEQGEANNNTKLVLLTTEREFQVIDGVHVLDIKFARKKLKTLNGNLTPKCVLREFCLQKRIKMVTFESVCS